MALQETIQNDLKEALKSNEAERLSVLRLLSSAITNKAIELQKKDEGLSDEEVLDVIRAEVKKRKDAIAEYKKAGRDNLSQKEEKERDLLSTYLPAELSDEEVKRIVQESITQTGAETMKDFGQLMKHAMEAVKGNASGDRVSAIARELLSSDK